ncbi:hypothetical protein COO60DRAFT_988185 [Scenedesmus sp. NREL 46B-D3]|nr:hypothetical protein COO60DRAFT_988185 [Scenedesmus sp. NREL 46B-D3]
MGPSAQEFAAAAAAAAAAGGQGGHGGPGGPPLSQQRLFVVVHKSVSDDQLRLLFRQYPGMEYCDLKRDKATGKSKGYCYVNYSTPNAAAAAVNELNGIEFPVGRGFRLKVMYAEIMTGGGAGSSSSSNAAAAAVAMMRSSSSRSSLRTPSAGHLGALARGGSGGLTQLHSSSSGALMAQGPLCALGSIGSQLGPPGSVGGCASGPSSTGGGIAVGGWHAAQRGGARIGSGCVGGRRQRRHAWRHGHGQQGPQPCRHAHGGAHQHQHQRPHQQQGLTCGEVGHVADSLGAMSLPCMAGANPVLGSMGSMASDPGSDAAAAAAAAAQHYEHLQASAAAAAVGGGSSVARELMFNVG